MKITRHPYKMLLIAATSCVLACGGKGKGGEDTAEEDVADTSDEDGQADVVEEDGAADAEADADEPGPGPEFDRFCGTEPWDTSLVPAVVNELGGTYEGYYDLPVGALETTKVIPAHPFHPTKIRVAFAGGYGRARIRLLHALGRSYPDTTTEDIIEPVELDVTGAGPNTWFEIDISDREVYMLPTEHYVVAYERVEATLPVPPMLAAESLVAGDYSRGLIIVPGEFMPYGIGDANYRLELEGDYFCSMDPADRWFAEDSSQPFVGTASPRVAVADLDGDRHDDLVFNAGGPYAYLGDGTGAFAAPGADPFPDVPDASMLVFGDLDNDGDRDAFAATYVGWDSDGDGETKPEGDCNDAVATVGHAEAEVAGNGRDDDCDTVADDGTDTSDADADTFTIAAGDCDDTSATTYPGAPEILDERDNDCDASADEDFVHRILLNDGTGLFTAVVSAGVEVLEPTAAAGFGDGDADGFLDVYWGNWLIHYPDSPAVADHYATGDGDGTFTDSTSAAGMALSSPLPCYGVMWTDYNNDGHEDVWVGNYGGFRNLLWRNDGDGTFTDVAGATGIDGDGIGVTDGTSFGGDFGDFDNDGDMDNYTANICHPRYLPGSDISPFYVNQGPPDYNFVNERESLGLIYDEGDVNAAFGDFDNDMDLDLVVASLYTGHFSRLYRNDGPDGMVDVTYESGTNVNDAVSAAWLDADEDGDLDLVIADRRGPEYLHFFENLVGQDSSWVELILEGTTTNRDAIGARVTLTSGSVTQTRDVEGGGGHSNTQSSMVMHFGLGSETAIDSVTVRWVGGATETITGIATLGRYLVVEGSGTGTLLP